MKQKNIRTLFVTTAFVLAIGGAWADAWTDSDTGYTWTYYYTYSNRPVLEIANYDYHGNVSVAVTPSPKGNLTIPSKINGDYVESIGSYAFAGCADLTSVTVPASVFYVDSSAFSGCSRLKSVVFEGENATMIADSFPKSCRFFVSRESTGWGVSIPGTWNGHEVRYVEDFLPPQPSDRPLRPGVWYGTEASGCHVADYSAVMQRADADNKPFVAVFGHKQCPYCRLYLQQDIDPTIALPMDAFLYNAYFANMEEQTSDMNYQSAHKSITAMKWSAAWPLVYLRWRKADGTLMERVRYYGEEVNGERTYHKTVEDLMAYVDEMRDGVSCYVQFYHADGKFSTLTLRVVKPNSLIGELPIPSRDGFGFKGWYTSDQGGDRVLPSYVVPQDMTLYAHWERLEALVAGSSPESAIPFSFGPSVATYPVTLTREWLEDEGCYDDASGVLYCKATVTRGKVYTIALPVGQEFEVTCDNGGALVEYATYGSLRYCRIDVRNIVAATADIMLKVMGTAGSKATVYVVGGDLVPANAVYEDPEDGGQPGSCLGKATEFAFSAAVQAKSVRLVREWDEARERYLDGGVHYLTATAPSDGILTVAVPLSQADGCLVTRAGYGVSPREDFGALAYWIFDVEAGDKVLVRLSGVRGTDAAVYTYGGDFLAKRLIFDPNGGTCPVASKSVRAGQPVDDLPAPDARSGYWFRGWFTAREGGVRVTAATVMVGYDVTLYAHWERLDISAWSTVVRRTLGGDGYRLNFGGLAPWYSTGYGCCGVAGVVRSGEIASNGSSVLEMTVPGPGELSFDWSVSSERNYDLLTFSVDGVEIAQISGEVNWSNVVHSISGKGTHVIRWIYHKDGAVSDGDDCGRLRRVAWNGEKYTANIHLVANGGYVANPVVTRGIGAWYDIDDPIREGYGFLGWYTARNGGTLVWTDDRIGETDVTLYAHWQYVNVGSCPGGARRLYMGKGIASQPTTLTSYWYVDEDGVGRYDSEEGVYYYKVALKRGRVYTFAKPYDDCDFEVWSLEELEDATYGSDGKLEYYIVDTSEMTSAEADIYVDIYGDVRARTTLYYAEGNYAPLGLLAHPEIVSGALNGKEFSVSAVRTLRKREYWFQVSAEPGVSYGFSVLGRRNISLDVQTSRNGNLCNYCGQTGGNHLPLDKSETTGNAAAVSFHVDEARPIWIRVMADETGDFTASAHWTKYDPDAEKWQLLDALGRPNGEVETGGVAAWTVDSLGARSGEINDNETSWLELALQGSGQISFEWKASSESGWDKLLFSVDDSTQGILSGETGWQSVSMDIEGDGAHFVRWTYAKDGSASSGADCGWIRNVRWISAFPHEIEINLVANGGRVPVGHVLVMTNDRYGSLPEAVRDGNFFAGWHTALDGGLRIGSEDMVMDSVGVLYAHWEKAVVGSSASAAIPFAFGQTVAVYPVTLAKEWLVDEGRYDDVLGVLYCKSSVVRGKTYTIALPVGQEFEVACGDTGARVEYATYGVLRYCRVDARDLVGAMAEVVLSVFGRAGDRTTVYVIEGDLVPAKAEYEDPGAGGLLGSHLGRASELGFAAAVQAKSVRLVREWDEGEKRYLDGGVHYLRGASPFDGALTVAVPAAQADGCEVVCEGDAAVREDFGTLALWIFDANEGDEVVVRLSGVRGSTVAVYTFGGDYLAKKLIFDPNGGTCPVESRDVRAGAPVGELPVPDDRAGHFFLGWFTAREGGARVTAATVMVGYDVTLYAHWEKLVAGSSPEAAIPFAMTTSLAAYPVSLTREWLEDDLRYADRWGTLYCKTTLKRGRVYTMAVPKGLDEVVAWCVNGEASVTYGSDASLQYVRFDTTRMAAAETEAYFAVFGDVGQRTTIYAVEADVMPKGCTSCVDEP